MNIIEVKNLQKTYDGVKVVDGISFEVKKVKYLVYWDQMVQVKQHP